MKRLREAPTYQFSVVDQFEVLSDEATYVIDDDVWAEYEEAIIRLDDLHERIADVARRIEPTAPSELSIEELQEECDHRDDYGSLEMDGKCMLCYKKLR